MRNKGFFWSITIALALACVYQLSFKWATSGVEADAAEYGNEKLDSLVSFQVPTVVLGRDTFTVADEKQQEAIANHYRQQYLKDIANEVVHFGYTYAECKENELNFGLDLQGGMSVTLEISVPEMVNELAGNTRNSAFRIPFEKALERSNAGEGDFIDLFREEFEKGGESMAKIFHPHNREEILADATNEEVVRFLKDKANSALDGVEVIIEKRVNTFGVSQPTIQKQTASNRIYVELPGAVDPETVRRRLQATANLEFFEVYNNAGEDNIGYRLFEEIQPMVSDELEKSQGLSTGTDTATAIEATDTALTTLEQAPDTTTNNLLGNLESEDTATNDLLSDVESEDTAVSADMTEEERRLKFPISSVLQPALMYNDQGQPVNFADGSVIGYALVKDTASVNAILKHRVVRENLPDDLVFMWDAKEILDENKLKTGTIRLNAIKVPSDGALVDGEDIDKAGYATDPVTQEVKVTMDMTQIGREKWADITGNNVGEQIAITMDGLVYSAPVVEAKMTTGYSYISGPGIDLKEAKELSGLLNAGALPAPARIIDESVVGPTIGEENIRAGFISFAVAFIIVLLYMVFYYGRAGMIANVALIVNIFFLVGALASLKAILTLPGIAGIVLTIGMAVDANVLIFERVREELRHGKGLKAAVDEGFRRALSSILDGNITTLLTGIVLAVFGTGPIKGFATTLIIGIFTSFFAAVVVTRLIVSHFIDRDKKVNFATKVTENWMTNVALPFVKKRRLFYLISGVIIVVGLVSLFTRGLDLGVDFQGGRQYTVVFNDQEADYPMIAEKLTDDFEGQTPSVKMIDNRYTALITTKYRITEVNDTSVTTQVREKLQQGLSEFGSFEVTSQRMIAPAISTDLKNNSIIAVVISLVVIFIYIIFRFRRWQFALGATLSLAHDVLILLGLFSIFWGVLPFSLEIDQAFIAAVLTVVGYSINDTVIIFDRVREYFTLYPKREEGEVINQAVNSTIGRTLNTSMTTFLVLLAMFIMGGEAIKGFIFAIMIGVIVGTYSSVCIAAPTVFEFRKKKTEPKI